MRRSLGKESISQKSRGIEDVPVVERFLPAGATGSGSFRMVID
jgi:hypothetical protein